MSTAYEKFQLFSEIVKIRVQLIFCGITNDQELGVVPDLSHIAFFVLLTIKMFDVLDISWSLVLLPFYWGALAFFIMNFVYMLTGFVQMVFYYIMYKMGG